MAFGFQYLQRIEVTPNLDKTLNVGQGQDSQPSPGMWTYNASASGSNEAEGVVDAANYFLPAYGYLKVGDFIFANTNDPASHIFTIATSTSGGVTVTVLV